MGKSTDSSNDFDKLFKKPKFDPSIFKKPKFDPSIFMANSDPEKYKDTAHIIYIDTEMAQKAERPPKRPFNKKFYPVNDA